MNKQLSVSLGQHSIAGQKTLNQDFYGALIPNGPLLTTKGITVALADGISSSTVSQEASQAAVTNFINDYYSTSPAWSVKTSGHRVLKAMNSWLYSQTQQSPYRFNKDKGYICTFSGIVIKSRTAHIFHSGDSRIYRIHNNKLEQLTKDHRRDVSEDIHYLTRALGVHDYLEMDYQSITVNEGDIFLLATDGVYEYLPTDAITDACNTLTHDNISTATQNLVTQAYEAGSPDNLTLQLLKIESLPSHQINEVHAQLNHLQSPPKLQVRKSFEGYTILRDLYISSRSHVYLAQDQETHQKVALKIPSEEMKDNEDHLESFLMEDWIAQRLNNAHILKAVEKKTDTQYLYTVTEYIEGKTLAQWMLDNPKPTIDAVRIIVEQIAKGLQAFHRQEMVHQDIRPNNIMIDASGVVKIIDFGSTKVAGITDIKASNEGIMGTAQYTAPEYFIGESGTSRSDLFSLGVLTYQMLSGRLPYGSGIARTRTARDQQKLSYHALTLDNPDIPGWIDYAIQKAVAIRPDKRYIEVSEFIYELTHPNKQYLQRKKPPLIERNPVRFWQGISLILLIVIVGQYAIFIA